MNEPRGPVRRMLPRSADGYPHIWARICTHTYNERRETRPYTFLHLLTTDVVMAYVVMAYNKYSYGLRNVERHVHTHFYTF